MIATLHILKGASQGQDVPLDGDRFILGREPQKCHFVIPVTSVSREHAQIVRVNGKFFIEDKQSRNGTFVNNQAITARTPLKNNDKIRICDFLATFHDAIHRLPLPAELARRRGGGTRRRRGPGTGGDHQHHSSHLLLETQPAEKLNALLEISGNLSKTLELKPLLPKIVDSLFQLFRQADRCFIILREEATDKLMPRVIKTRRPHDESNARFSRSIVRQCLDKLQAFLSDDASRDERIQLSQSVVDFRIRSVMCAPLGSRRRQAVRRHPARHPGPQQEVHPGRPEAAVGRGQPGVDRPGERPAARGSRGPANACSRDLELAHQVQLSFLPQEAARGARLRVLRPLRAGPGGRRRLLRLHPAARRARWRSRWATWPARACRRRC